MARDLYEELGYISLVSPFKKVHIYENSNWKLCDKAGTASIIKIPAIPKRWTMRYLVIVGTRSCLILLSTSLIERLFIFFILFCFVFLIWEYKSMHYLKSRICGWRGYWELSSAYFRLPVPRAARPAQPAERGGGRGKTSVLKGLLPSWPKWPWRLGWSQNGQIRDYILNYHR